MDIHLHYIHAILIHLTVSNSFKPIPTQVLQHGVNAVVWGWAPRGTVVNTTLRGVIHQSSVNSTSGLWRQLLPPQPASLVSVNLTFAAKIGGSLQTITLTNILFGEVLFCSGQSNVRTPKLGPSTTPL